MRTYGNRILTTTKAIKLFCLVLLVGTAMGPAAGAIEGAADTWVIQISRPVVYPDDRQSRDQLEAALQQAARHLSRTRDGLTVVDWRATPPRVDYRISVNAVNDPSAPTVALSIEPSTPAQAGAGDQATGATAGIPVTRPWDGDLYRHLAQQYFYLWAQIRGFRSLERREPPRFVDELDLGELVGSTLSSPGLVLYPYSAAPVAGGGVVVGAISVAVSLAPDFRVEALPGRNLLERGAMNSAMAVATTPAGTVVTRPSMGRELYLYPPGQAEPRRLRSPLTGQGPITALPDGSVVVTDTAARRAVRIDGRQRIPLDLYDLDYSYIPALAAGPAGNIWTYDTSQRRILVYSPDGALLETILPAMPVESAGGVRAMAVGPGGDVLLLATDGLWRLDRGGAPLWSLTALGDDAGSGLGQMMGLAWDAESGAIWLADYMGQRILRLQEPVEEDSGGDTAAFIGDILRINREIQVNSRPDRRAELYAEKARRYAERGALEMAQAQWQRVLEDAPFHPDAPGAIDAIEVRLLLREVRRLDAVVRRSIAEYGRETARADYQRTIRLYEQLLNLDPEAPGVAEAKRSLEGVFENRGPAPPDRDILQLAVAPEPLFPVLLEQYRRGGAGTLTVTNAGETEVEELSLAATIPGFSDTAVSIAQDQALAPGSTRELPLSVLLNRSALALQEDLTVPVVVEARYRGGDPANSASAVTRGRAETTLHRRTALVWDDSAKLASFVTPNEEVVAGFALRALAAGQGALTDRGAEGAARDRLRALSPRLLSAVTVGDALGAYGISYVEDPRSPFSEVQGVPQAVDTIRFPRTTLYYRSGDCDDTSALLASLYEAVGLDTAVITTPGHVMIGVDTREPVGNAWLFETGTTTVVPYDGTLWVPVETTVLNQGFIAAWEAGSELVRRHRETRDYSVIAVRDVRDRYPSLPLPPQSFTVTEPPPATILDRTDRSAAYALTALYEGARAELDNELAARTGRRRVPILNRLGVVHARFGYHQRARRALAEIVELRSDYLPVYINLANLELLVGDAAAALRWLEAAEMLDSRSALVLELLARAHYAAGNGREAQEYRRRLADRAPERAEGLAALEDDGPGNPAGQGRAGRQDNPAPAMPPAPWPGED